MPVYSFFISLSRRLGCKASHLFEAGIGQEGCLKFLTACLKPGIWCECECEQGPRSWNPPYPLGQDTATLQAGDFLQRGPPPHSVTDPPALYPSLILACPYRLLPGYCCNTGEVPPSHITVACYWESPYTPCEIVLPPR
ncbi:hypothetical protein XELAEV_18000533mg [Xenopus laevis]|nr:hypothetical protein XELAEV_18000533mg [Xenopus laevis]